MEPVENNPNVSCRRSPLSRALPSVLLAVCLAAPAAAGAADLSDQILVRHRAAATAADRADVRADAGVRLDERLPLTGVELVETTTGETRADALDALRDDPDVLWAEPNREVSVATNDTFWDEQYALENLGGTGGLRDADVDIPEAWSVSTGTGVTVGVVDTGSRSDHPDLAGQLVPGRYYLGDSNPSTQDFNGHGTHVSGIIAARSGNAEGISGAAPGAKVKPYRALGANGRGTTAAVAAAFADAGADGLRVVNASLGSASPSNAERQAITSSPGTLFVVAAGNEGINVDTGTATSYPCRYTYDNVLCVGASTDVDTAAGFSNRGQASVDLFAPGDAIASTFFDPDDGLVGYAYSSGTSMASPLVAAAAALVAAQNPTWTPAQLKAALLNSVDHPAALADVSATGGRLNAARALGVDVGPDGRAPDAPEALTAVGSPGRVDLSWSIATATDFAAYRVYRRSGPSTWTVVAQPTSASAALTGLAVGESVTLRVTAVDRSGAESPASPEATVKAEAGQVAVAPTATDPTPDPAAGPTPPAGDRVSGDGTMWTSPAPGSGGATPGTTPPSSSPGAPASPAPPAAAPSVVAPLVTNLRATKTRGRVQAVRFSLSAAATVKVVATRARTKARPPLTRKRSLSLEAGTPSVAVDRTARGLALPPGQWRLTVSVGTSARTIAFRLP